MKNFQLVEAPVLPPRVAEMAALADEALAFHHSLPSYAPTPLRSLGGLAADLGVASIQLKDESGRFGLNAFKGLGASFAVHRWITTHPSETVPTFTTATDGNHGRAVAWSARRAGARAVIFLPAYARPARIDAIKREGAEVVLVDEGYDAAVRMANDAARERGWVLIQDSAWAGYEEIPEWIAAGYWTHAREMEPDPHGTEPGVDLVLLHAGVGTWAAAMTNYYWHRYGARRPRLVVVEPVDAPCLLRAAPSGVPVEVEITRHTVMAGLDCGLASTSALEILRHSVDAFVAIDDRWALDAMRRLANPTGGDPVVVAGESGAASLGALMALLKEPELAPVRAHLELDATTRVLVWSTEGATDPEHWAEVVGRPAPPVA